MREPHLHETVAAVLRDAIRSGKLAPGGDVPAEEELAREHGVSRDTVRRAIGTLEREGLLTAGHGRAGRRVQTRDVLTFWGSRSESIARAGERERAGVDAWVADCAEQGHEGTQSIAVAVEHPDPAMIRRLGLAPGEAVVVRKRVRYLDGRPSNISDTYYPHSIAGDTPIMHPADVTQGIVQLMLDMGHRQVRYDDELETRMPAPDEVEALRIPPGWPVLVQTRTGFTAERPVKVSITIWPGDRARLVYELPA
jgi:GntR family transcriptional regulator